MENSPRYFALESLSNNKYLRFLHEDGALHGHLEFSGEEVISLYTKYELEPARSGAYRGLFNIRCCYNNKYWRRREESTGWITATAAEPVEDQFKWSSTLFEASVVKQSRDGKLMLTLRHVQHSRYVPVSIGSHDPTYRLCLIADGNPPIPSRDEDSNNTAFSILDWESFVILPKLVMLKGGDGLYLRYQMAYLVFNTSGDSLPIDSIEVLYTRDGSVRLLPHINGNLLSLFFQDDLHLLAGGSNSYFKPGDFKTWFWIVKGDGDNEVAIRSKFTTLFCQRPTQADASNNYFITAGARTMAKETIMRVEEPVVSRSVYDVNFRLQDARIYNQSDVIIVRKQFSNPLDVDEAVHLIQTFTKETTRTWNSIVTLKLATLTTIETNIPSIVGGEVDFTEEFVGRYKWGTDMKGSETTELSDHINIPPRSTVTVHVMATRGTCDVPFYYMQRDSRKDGKVYINKMDDGVYTGINYYNFKVQVVKTTLMAAKN